MNPRVNGIAALLLQVGVALFAAAVLAFLLWEPHIEGRNADATTFEIYFTDPFLAFVYLGSIPVFVACHRAFRLLGHARATGAYSQFTVDALRVIKRCALVVIGFVAVGVAIIVVFGDGEDRPAGVFMGFLVFAASGVVALVAAMFARKLKETLGLPDAARAAGSSQA